MVAITLRADLSRGLNNAEIDANFSNLKTAVEAAALSASWASITGKPATLAGFGITDAQSALVSGTSIKTVNGQSVLGSGNIQIDGGVTSFNTRTGAITLGSGDVTTALGFTPYNATNPSGFISGINSSMVTTALGFTPYNATNPSGYITSAALSSYLPLSGGTLTGLLTFNRAAGLRGIDAATNDNYVSMRVVANNTLSGGNADGMYIGYQNGNSGVTRIFGGGAASGGIVVSGSGPNDVTIAGNVALHAGNYNSYALPLTGGTVTGTITGTSFSDGYITWGAAQLNRAGSNIELQWAGSAGSTVFIGANGPKPIRFYADTGNALFSGTLNALGAITQNGNQVLHAGNYGSYSVPRSEFRSFGDIVIDPNGQNANCTTAQFMAHLSTLGFFNYASAVGKCVWSYAGNNDLTDTGFGTIDLAGCVIETWKSGNEKHVRLTRPTTGAGGYQVLVYVDHGSGYSPGWRAFITSENIGSQSVSYATSAGSATDNTKLPLSGGTLTGALNVARQRLSFSSSYNDANHSIYNNYTNIDGEGVFDGMKMNVYDGLRIRVGNASGVTPTTLLALSSSSVRINTQLQVGQNTNGTAIIDAFDGIARFGLDSTSYGLRLDSSNYATFQNANGYLQLGPLNTSHSHFQTDRPSFYFNKDVLIDGQLYRYNGTLPYLHTGNYNSYSPTLTGTGASGTWGINITGAAASAVTLSNNATISGLNFGGVLALTASGASTGNATGARLTESYGPQWNLGDSATWHYQILNGSLLVGISAGGTNYGSGNIRAAGNLYAGTSNLVLHAGNYNSYAPTLTGGGASGTWGINITGTANNITAYTINQNLGTGNQPTFDSVITNNNGNGTNIRLGDDVWLGDCNLANTFRIRGSQDAAAGFIVFGSDTTQLGRTGAGALTWGGNAILNAGNYGSYALALFGSTLNISDWNTLTGFGSRRTAPDGVDTNGPPINQYGNLLVFGGDSGVTQLQAGHDGRLAWRTKWNAADWTGWQIALDSGNYNSYAPTLTGSGASGTWGISVTGNAATVTSVTSSQVTTALGYTPANKAGDTFTGAVLTSNAGGFTANSAAKLWTDSSRGRLDLYEGAAQTKSLRVFNANGYGIVGMTSAENLELWTNGTARITINGSSGISTFAANVIANAGVDSRFQVQSSGVTQGQFQATATAVRLASNNTLPLYLSQNGVDVLDVTTTAIVGNRHFRVPNSSSYNFAFVGEQAAGTGKFNLYMSGTAANYMAGALEVGGNITANSDERLKKDWAALPVDFIERLAAVKSGTYTRIDSGERQAGSSAQDWQALLPEVVMTGADKNQTLSLAYGNAALVAVIELAREVVSLRRELNEMKGA